MPTTSHTTVSRVLMGSHAFVRGSNASMGADNAALPAEAFGSSLSTVLRCRSHSSSSLPLVSALTHDRCWSRANGAKVAISAGNVAIAGVHHSHLPAPLPLERSDSPGWATRAWLCLSRVCTPALRRLAEMRWIDA